MQESEENQSASEAPRRRDDPKRKEMRERADVRLRAESRVRHLLKNRPDPADREAVERLLYELGVHQVELEIQNEQLREAQSRLEESRDRYARLFEEAPVGYVITAPDGRIVEANQRAARMLGVRAELLSRRHFREFVETDDRPLLRLHENRLMSGDVPEQFELRILAASSECRRMAVQMDVERNQDSTWRRIRMALMDVDERAQLQENLTRLAAIVASSEDAIIGRDRAGRVTSWNDGARRLFGYDADEMIGRSVEVLVPTDRHLEEQKLLDRLWHGETVAHLETERLARGRVVVPVSISLSPVRDDQQRVVGSSLIARDISERRRADRALRERLHQLDVLCQAGQSLILGGDDVGRLRHQLFDKLCLAVDCEFCLDYVADERGRTARLEWTSGFTSEQVDHGDAVRLVGSAFGTAIKRAAPLVVDGVGEIEAAPSPLDRVDVQCYAAFPIKSGQRAWGIAVFATARRRSFSRGHVQIIQTICDQIAAMLDRQRLMEELHERGQALRAADEAKDAFIATLAHELRNPLAAIRNAVELMKQAGTRDERRVGWCRDVIGRQVAQLTHLLEDLLDISRLSRNRVELRCEPIDLVRTLQQALESTRAMIEARGHRLRVRLPDTPVRLLGDATRLTQVFTNLLHNASKYTDYGGEITLLLTNEGTVARVAVTDNGIGIEEANLQRVFEMFAQFSGRSGGGLGIGLALTRGLVELHGGRIEARSEGPGSGSEFIVTLPLLEQAPVLEDRTADGEELEPDEPVQSARCRVLVADDNVDAAQTLATMLASRGHDVRTVYGGCTVVEIVKQWRPDAILLDIGMPDMNGYEVCRAVRALDADRRTLIVACTGWGQENDRNRSRDAGFDEHLVKPIEPHAVLGLLRSIAPRTARRDA